MTDRCIDEVATPLKRLQLMPEELVVLKIIMLFSCGNHTQNGKNISYVKKKFFRRYYNVYFKREPKGDY